MRLAQRAYEAYSAATGGVSLATGQALPTWDDLPESFQQAWIASVSDAHRLRTALVKLIGSECASELAQMEAVIRVAPICDQDRANTLNALHAIRDTI